MLLRLLPNASTAQPTPPTILFTLPLPNHPYTGRSLPLPANLLAHKSVCLHEDIECPNVLLGDKSAWISGVSHPRRQAISDHHANLISQIIEDVTFSLPLNNIRIHFIDCSSTTLPLSDSCAQSLAGVIDQVNKSFAPQPTSARPLSPSASSTSSRSSLSSVPSPRRSTSALLLTLLSPLLPGTSNSYSSQQQSAARIHQAANDPQQIVRLHRRQARSLLVDTYRCFVLPELKASLPSAYLPWAIESEVAQRHAAYECIKLEINSILSSTGYDTDKSSIYNTPCKRARSLTASTQSSSSSESDESEYLETPMSSAQSSRSPSPNARVVTASPHAFLLSIPPAHELPSAYRSTYAHHLADLTRIASRVSAIKRLDSQYEREEGKRQWLENLERGKAGDRSLRRAWSNGETKIVDCSKPIRASKLRRSWTAEDEERHLMPLALAVPVAVHPAMMSDDDDESDGGYSSEDMSLVTPPPTATYGRRNSMTVPSPVRPALVSRHSTMGITVSDIEMEDEESGLVAPPMMTSKSDDSIAESDSWDQDRDSISATSSNDDQDEVDDSAAIIRASIQQVALADSKSFTLPNLPSREHWVDAYLSSSPTGFNAKTLGQCLKQKVVDWARHDSLTDNDHDHLKVPLVF